MASKVKVEWCLFLIWSLITITVILHHAFWMDEVINLIFAIGADSQYGIHGNGHPAIWFLLLRALYAIFHKVWVLPLASFLVAATAIWLFLFKSPFSLRFKILVLCSNFALYEYVVMARNYGISMLFMFLLAIVATNDKIKNKLTGPCLFLLCNTNIHSVIISFSYVCGLFVGAIKDKSIKLKETRKALFNASVGACAGAIVCFFTIFPTFDTVAGKQFTNGINVKNILSTLILSENFEKISYETYIIKKTPNQIRKINQQYQMEENKNLLPLVIDNKECLQEFYSKKYSSKCVPSGKDKIKRKYISVWDDILIFSSAICIFLSFFAFYGDICCLISSIVSFVVLDLFFIVIYHGAYRHQALWLVFMLVLLWISKKENFRFSGKIETIRLLGRRSFAFLLFLQIGPSVINIYNELYSTPNSNSKSFSYFLNGNKQLKNSAIISTSDVLLEGIHYYSTVPTFMMSQRKFGVVFPFAKSEKSSYSMDDVLNAANLISVCNQVPVLIMVSDAYYNEHRVEPEEIKYPALYHYFFLDFYINPQQLARLQNQTHKIARFEHAANDEGFSVYQLLPKDAHSEERCSPQYIFNRKAFDLENLNK